MEWPYAIITVSFLCLHSKLTERVLINSQPARSRELSLHGVAVTCICAYWVRIVNGRGFSRNPIDAQAHHDFMVSWVKSKLEQKPIFAAGREALPCYLVDDLGLYGSTYLLGAIRSEHT